MWPGRLVKDKSQIQNDKFQKKNIVERPHFSLSASVLPDYGGLRFSSIFSER
jgi:hypothetical protein